MTTSKTLLEVRDLRKWFKIGKGLFTQPKYVKAVDGVSFSLEKGETLGIVGESGCGKSTLARLIMRLIEADSGKVLSKGKDVTHVKGKELKNVRKNMQMIFQDSYASLNPRMRIGKIIGEPLIIHGEGTARERRSRVEEVLELVGLSRKSYDKFPHQFSGGQRQRLDIARALVCNPEIIICDEAVSALDVSVQSQILNLLKDLQKKLNLSYLFISHDLSVVRHISDTVLVMYLGQTVEVAGKYDFFEQPLHPYSQALISAAPRPDPDAVSQQIVLSGEVPNPMNPPYGCFFHPRCPLADEKCRTEAQKLIEVSPDRFAACWKLNDGSRPRLSPPDSA
ncbi:ABC transporter ATP-binding protein [Desulfosediminicola ganghwensis]|uniref:ABC transporter ATP-binding protein n=1 Tax=Desulfosediminicola ganghwensis TaxID=2569540 RepID=UPI0010AC9AF3|nr:dipeptide ABC transporter ATP-binding protein [Desulfosediminicola ganghwensis]